MEARIASTESNPLPLAWQVGLVALAVAFTVGLTFASIELPRLAHEALSAHQQAPGFDSRGSELEVEKTEAWIAHHHLRPIGYASLVLVVALIVVGFATRRTGLASLGAVALFLPVSPLVAALEGTPARSDVVIALGQIGSAEAVGDFASPRAVAHLATALDDETRRVRVAALFALARIPSEDVVPHLSRALHDEDWEIRIYAGEALKKRGHAPR